MDWFERLTHFRESSYAETRARLSVVDGRLSVNGTDRSYGVGRLTLPSLSELRIKANRVHRAGPSRLSIVQGDVRALHGHEENQGALFQVASQFNMLEMVGPDLTPEDGVTRYAYDRTQGPACAIAAGAATIYRNYFAPVADGIGQTADRQLDGLADLGRALAQRLNWIVEDLWRMQNGYALPTASGLAALSDLLETLDENERDALRGLMQFGLHQDVEVTDGPLPGQTVSQIFCSALPIAYCRLPKAHWTSFARLVLEAAYEATLLAGVLNAERGASNRILLTRLGGGAFGNADEWIDDALVRAVRIVGERDLDIVVVSYGLPTQHFTQQLARTGLLKTSGG